MGEAAFRGEPKTQEMRNALFAFFALILVTWLGLQLFPGHSYLRGETQLYVPMLERLASPGFLSRDLVATHPNVTYTVYDEATLFLTQGLGLNLRIALELQQALFRFAWIAGTYLIARTCRLDRFWAVLIAATLSLGAALPGADVITLDPEPLPRSFAFGLTFLAIGWVGDEKPLLAGLAGGLAMIYDARVAAPFWIVLLIAFAFDKKLRHLFRPCIPIVVVFALLLANLAQLQPGAAQSQDLLGNVTPSYAAILQMRAPWVWVSRWAPKEIWHYLAIAILGFWATARIWTKLNRQLRWMFVCLPLAGLLSVPVSYLFMERLRLAIVPAVEPGKTLAFTVAISAMACGIAGMNAVRRQARLEATAWFALVFLMETNVRILDTLRLVHPMYVSQIFIAAILGSTLAWTALGPGRRIFAPLVPFAAMLIVPLVIKYDGRGTPQHMERQRPVSELAAWAGDSTWAGSVFAFPDAFAMQYPGIFRADSQRAIWADWESGTQSIYSEPFAEEWSRRWREMMQPKFSAGRLQGMLSLPVDYYVLKREHALAVDEHERIRDISPVFTNGEFVVYEANQLRDVSGSLELAGSRPGG